MELHAGIDWYAWSVRTYWYYLAGKLCLLRLILSLGESDSVGVLGTDDCA